MCCSLVSCRCVLCGSHFHFVLCSLLCWDSHHSLIYPGQALHHGAISHTMVSVCCFQFLFPCPDMFAIHNNYTFLVGNWYMYITYLHPFLCPLLLVTFPFVPPFIITYLSSCSLFNLGFSYERNDVIFNKIFQVVSQWPSVLSENWEGLACFSRPSYLIFFWISHFLFNSLSVCYIKAK